MLSSDTFLILFTLGLSLVCQCVLRLVGFLFSVNSDMSHIDKVSFSDYQYVVPGYFSDQKISDCIDVEIPSHWSQFLCDL